jgi:2-keto-3-deoxy-L-rhamnonate aldolase RhmA
MKLARRLKKKINSDQLTVGVLATVHCWPGLVEMLVKAGFDYLIIDFEHGVFDAEMAVQTCTLGRLAGLPVLIRPAAADPALMSTALDAGPVGLLLPYVETLEDMQRIQDAIYLPPRGRRRPGGAGNHWVSGYHYENWRTEVEDDLIILPQIETRRGLQNAEAIARHEITTAIATGPYDLSVDMGLCWQPNHPRLLEAIESVREAGKKAGKNIWMNGQPDDLKKRGFTFLCAAEPMMLLEGALTEVVQRLKCGKSLPLSESDQPLS